MKQDGRLTHRPAPRFLSEADMRPNATHYAEDALANQTREGPVGEAEYGSKKSGSDTVRYVPEQPKGVPEQPKGDRRLHATPRW